MNKVNGKIVYMLHPTSIPYRSTVVTSDELKRIHDYLDKHWAMDNTISQDALNFMAEIDGMHIMEESDLGQCDKLTTKSVKIIAAYENNKFWKYGGWDKHAFRWFAHKSIEGGTRTLAYGHKITKDEHNTGKIVIEGTMLSIENGLVDFLAIDLLEQDICIKIIAAKKLINEYHTFPEYIKRAIINGFYRGDLSGSPMTIKHINEGKWLKAAIEYLDNREYLSQRTMKGIKTRMEDNAEAFKLYGNALSSNNGVVDA